MENCGKNSLNNTNFTVQNSMNSHRSLANQDFGLSSLPPNFYTRNDKSMAAHYENKIKDIVTNDEIIQALKNNPTSTEFISERVKEIVEETIVADKERQIQELLGEMEILKQEVAKYDQRLSEIKHHQATQDSEIETKYKIENQRLQQQLAELNDQVKYFDSSQRFENQRSQKDKAVFEEEIQRLSEKLGSTTRDNEALKSQINELNSDCQTMQRLYKILEQNHEKLKIDFSEKNEELKTTLSESNNFQTSNFELALQVKQLEEELVRIGQSKETIENAKGELLQKFNQYGSVIQKECEDKILACKNKYKDKKEKLVEKILSQKQKIDQFNHQKGQYEDTISGFKEDIKRVKQEWENKLYYEQLEFEKKISELTSKHKHEINQMQEEIQKAYEEKISEIEGDNEQEIEAHKREVDNLKELLDKSQQEIDDLRERNHQFKNLEIEKNEELKQITESIENELYSRIEEIEVELENTKEDNSLLQENIDTKDQTCKELTARLEDYDHKLQQNEARIEEILKENGALKSRLDNDFKTKNLENKIRENMALQDEIKTLQEKESNLLKDIETFKELNADLEKDRKAAIQTTKSDKNQIQILEQKLSKLEKELEESIDKHRKSKEADLDKYESEISAHSQAKADLRALKEKLTESKAKNEEIKRKNEREMNEIKVELEFTKKNLKAATTKNKELDKGKIQAEEDLQASKRKYRTKREYLIARLQTESQRKITQLKNEHNGFKKVIMELLKAHESSIKDNIPKILGAVSKIDENSKNSSIKYHEKNLKTLSKLEKELQTKCELVNSLQTDLSITKENLHTTQSHLEHSENEINDLRAQQKVLEKEYQICLKNLDSKNLKIQKLNSSITPSTLSKDAQTLTTIITKEIDKKYKQKILELLTLVEQNSSKYKQKLYNVRKLVFAHSASAAPAEAAYRSEQSLVTIKTLKLDLKSKENEVHKLKNDKKILHSNVVRLKKDNDSLRKAVCKKRKENDELAKLIQKTNEHISLSIGTIPMALKLTQEKKIASGRDRREENEDPNSG
ncbi:unnamed protein product [Moneuplotes crassus]|uniref:Uncharacterized protein n=1 Tax=Euplotes crassus TaxID=5936 RepID=A0AAD2D297_EUPCR|nr:unnamed protein product [Moneuplotes crassus]